MKIVASTYEIRIDFYGRVEFSKCFFASSEAIENYSQDIVDHR